MSGLVDSLQSNMHRSCQRIGSAENQGVTNRAVGASLRTVKNSDSRAGSDESEADVLRVDNPAVRRRANCSSRADTVGGRWHAENLESGSAPVQAFRGTRLEVLPASGPDWRTGVRLGG